MRKSLLFIVNFLIVLAIIVLALPSMISSRLGTNLLVRYYEKKYECTLSIEDLSIGWFSKQRINGLEFQKDDFTGNIEQIKANSTLLTLLKSRNNPQALLTTSEIQVENGNLSIGDKINLSKLNVTTKDKNQVVVSAETLEGGRKGNILLEGVITDSSHWKTQIRRFPTAILEKFTNGGSLRNMIGDSFNANGTLSFPGNNPKDFLFQQQMGSSLFSLEIDGRYNKGDITLRAPLKSNFRLNEKVFSNLHIISARSVTLFVPPEGVVIPIAPFSYKKLIIPEATLDLGRVQIKNFSGLSNLLSIIQLQPKLDSTLDMWIQPAIIQISDGICNISRTDLLLDNQYVIANWGSINLEKQRANLYVGLTAQSMRRALGFSKLPNDYVLPIRVDGPLDNLHVHTSGPIKTIAALTLLENQPLPFPIVPPDSTQVPRPRLPYPWSR